MGKKYKNASKDNRSFVSKYDDCNNVSNNYEETPNRVRLMMHDVKHKMEEELYELDNVDATDILEIFDGINVKNNDDILMVTFGGNPHAETKIKDNHVNIKIPFIYNEKDKEQDKNNNIFFRKYINVIQDVKPIAIKSFDNDGIKRTLFSKENVYKKYRENYELNEDKYNNYVKTFKENYNSILEDLYKKLVGKQGRDYKPQFTYYTSVNNQIKKIIDDENIMQILCDLYKILLKNNNQNFDEYINKIPDNKRDDEQQNVVNLIYNFKKRITMMLGMPLLPYMIRHYVQIDYIKKYFLIRPCNHKNKMPGVSEQCSNIKGELY